MRALNTHPIFEHLSPAGQHTLAHGLRSHVFAAGTQLLAKGQPVSGAYFVVSGRLRIYSISAQGVEATLYTLTPGETCMLALNSLFNDVCYPAWVETEVDTTVAVVSGRILRELFQTESSMRDTMVHSLATMVFGLINELQSVHACKLEQRLAHLLLTRCDSSGVLHMTQQAIAQHLGSSREVIARILSEWAHQHWIQTGRGVIRLCDSAAVRTLNLAQ